MAAESTWWHPALGARHLLACWQWLAGSGPGPCADMACKQPASHDCSEPPVRQPGGDYLRSETRGERAAPRPEAARSHESDGVVAVDERVPAHERRWDGQLCSPMPVRCALSVSAGVAAWGQGRYQ
jgi:hypothetical protein